MAEARRNAGRGGLRPVISSPLQARDQDWNPTNDPILQQTAQSARPKHGPHISISDDNHHVTDAISSLYDYAEQQAGNSSSRPLSFMPSAREEIQLGRLNQQQQRSPTTPLNPSPFNPAAAETRPTLDRRQSRNGGHTLPNGTGGSAGKSSEPDSPGSLQSPADTAESMFPINNIDYESSPAAVQQELSNLAAIRRMSMNVDVAGDPDLPSFSAGSPNSVDEDPNRLFWVPARLHPELAPKEFKSFLDSKADAIKRRSNEFTEPDQLGRSLSGGSASLRRTKSRLSRQIDNTGGQGAEGYEDGASVLDRKRSGASRLSVITTPGNSGHNLAELEALMEDPEKVIGRLSLEAAQKENGGEDMPILPGAGSGLKRSTRTTYRKGSLKRGERVVGSGRRQRTSEHQDQPPPMPIDPSGGIQRSATDPGRPASNFSRPRAQSPPSSAGLSPSFDSILSGNQNNNVERQAPAEAMSPPGTRDDRPYSAPAKQQDQPAPQIQISEPPIQSRLGSKFRRQASGGNDQPLQNATVAPSIAGSNSRTDNLAVVPTTDEKLTSKKTVSKKRSNDGSKKSAWSLSSLLGSDEKKEEKEKKKREAAEKAAERAAEKASAATDDEIIAERRQAKKGKVTDNTRLDLLQQTMEGSSRHRESLVLDRNDVDLEDARKSEGNRRSGGNKPKEKDVGLLHSLFGGKKNKADRDSHSAKSARSSLRPQSPNEPARAAAVPDVDYNWTRFSILEERAIYRMAHIKLANPRRELRSQVLLSNFMYSYLAKVQQMHPQIQIPQSAAQKAQQRQERERQRKEQPEEYYQYQRYQEVS